MSSEIKPRTVYFLKRTDKPDDGTDIYVGSTSLTLRERLRLHKKHSRFGRESKLYKRMREVGIDNWEIIPLLIYDCDKKTICKFEKKWVEVINADLSTNLPLGEKHNANNNKLLREQYRDNIKNKVHYCDVCDKSFGFKHDLRMHFNTLKHSYAYLNSLD